MRVKKEYISSLNFNKYICFKYEHESANRISDEQDIFF